MSSFRPNAVGLVDAFDYSDHHLNSVLGRYDGNVYEHLMKWAEAFPLNKTEVSRIAVHEKKLSTLAMFE